MAGKRHTNNEPFARFHTGDARFVIRNTRAMLKVGERYTICLDDKLCGKRHLNATLVKKMPEYALFLTEAGYATCIGYMDLASEIKRYDDRLVPEGVM